MDSPNTAGPARKPRRYRLAAVRAYAQTEERIKRFRLSAADGLPPLERLEPATRTAPPR